MDTEPAARFVGEVCGSGGCNKDIRIICLQCQIGGRCRTPLHIGRGERICSVRIDGHLPLCRGQGVSRVGDRGGSGKGQIIPVAVADEIRLTGNQCAHIGGGGVNRRRSRHSVRKAGLLNLERAICLCKRSVIAGQRPKVVSIAHIQGDGHHFLPLGGVGGLVNAYGGIGRVHVQNVIAVLHIAVGLPHGQGGFVIGRHGGHKLTHREAPDFRGIPAIGNGQENAVRAGIVPLGVQHLHGIGLNLSRRRGEDRRVGIQLVHGDLAQTRRADPDAGGIGLLHVLIVFIRHGRQAGRPLSHDLHGVAGHVRLVGRTAGAVVAPDAEHGARRIEVHRAGRKGLQLEGLVPDGVNRVDVAAVVSAVAADVIVVGIAVDDLEPVVVQDIWVGVLHAAPAAAPVVELVVGVQSQRFRIVVAVAEESVVEGAGGHAVGLDDVAHPVQELNQIAIFAICIHVGGAEAAAAPRKMLQVLTVLVSGDAEILDQTVAVRVGNAVEIAAVSVQQCQRKVHRFHVPHVQRLVGIVGGLALRPEGLAERGNSLIAAALQNRRHVAGHVDAGNDVHALGRRVEDQFLHLGGGEPVVDPVRGLGRLGGGIIVVAQRRGQIIGRSVGADDEVPVRIRDAKAQALIVGQVQVDLVHAVDGDVIDHGLQRHKARVLPPRVDMEDLIQRVAGGVAGGNVVLAPIFVLGRFIRKERDLGALRRVGGLLHRLLRGFRSCLYCRLRGRLGFLRGFRGLVRRRVRLCRGGRFCQSVHFRGKYAHGHYAHEHYQREKQRQQLFRRFQLKSSPFVK